MACPGLSKGSLSHTSLRGRGAGSTHKPRGVLLAQPLGSTSYLCRNRRNLYIPGASPAPAPTRPEHPRIRAGLWAGGLQAWAGQAGPYPPGYRPVPEAWPLIHKGDPAQTYLLTCRAQVALPSPPSVSPDLLCCCSHLRQPCRRIGVSCPPYCARNPKLGAHTEF